MRSEFAKLIAAKPRVTLAMIVAVSLLSGCSSLLPFASDDVCLSDEGDVVECPQMATESEPKDTMATTSPEMPATAPAAMQMSQYFDYPPNYTVVQDYADRLALELMQQKPQLEGAVAIASLVWLDGEFHRTSPLGNQFAEMMIAALSKQGVNVLDSKIGGALSYNNQGVWAFSREGGNGQVLSRARYVLVGTMLPDDKGVLINARIVEIGKGNVMAAQRMTLPRRIFSARF